MKRLSVFHRRPLVPNLLCVDTVGGLESMSMIDHTLLLEYRLGYIGSYEQVEREQERKKKTA